MSRPKKTETTGVAVTETFRTDSDQRRDPTAYEAMALTGIPVTMAQFQSAVNNGENIPENAFNANSEAKGRRVQMWLCPPILLCYHAKTYFWTPLVNVVHAR